MCLSWEQAIEICLHLEKRDVILATCGNNNQVPSADKTTGKLEQKKRMHEG